MKAALLYKSELLSLRDGQFVKVEPKRAKEYRIGALLPLASLVALSFQLPKNLSAEQLQIQVELKMYQEGGLDPNKEYTIDYLVYDLPNEEQLLIEAFAAEQAQIKEQFQEQIKTIGFLDLLFPRFIAYGALYEEATDRNDLYIYLGENEAFAAIYKDGRYIGYRQIDSLQKIAKRSGLELAKIKSFLSTKGIVGENYNLDEKHIFDSLLEIIYANVERVVYAINFKRSFFGLDHIDRLIIDFDGNDIEGLSNLFLSFGVEGEFRQEILECCGVAKSEASLALPLVYIERYDSLEQQLNFSFFERKKPIYQFSIVRYAAAVVGFVLFLGGVWGYVSYQQQILERELLPLQKRLSMLQKKNRSYKKAIERFDKQKKELLEQKERLQNQILQIEDTIAAIPFIERMHTTRQKMMNDVVEVLAKYRLSTKRIEQNGTRSMQIELVSKDRQRERIASFMQELLHRGYSDVRTKRIERNANFYKSLVEVVR